MVQSLLYWCELYDRLKFESLCLDIETVSFNGPISVVGIYRPRDGVMESDAFVRGRNLSADVLKAAFADCKMFITFNGRQFDVPHIRKLFPGAIPETMPVIDLYLFAHHSPITFEADIVMAAKVSLH